MSRLYKRDQTLGGKVSTCSTKILWKYPPKSEISIPIQLPRFTTCAPHGVYTSLLKSQQKLTMHSLKLTAKAPENSPSLKETGIPTIHFQVRKCWLQGGDMDVSKNRGGPPKWMVKIMENLIEMRWFGGKHHYFWFNTHILYQPSKSWSWGCRLVAKSFAKNIFSLKIQADMIFQTSHLGVDSTVAAFLLVLKPRFLPWCRGSSVSEWSLLGVPGVFFLNEKSYM